MKQPADRSGEQQEERLFGGARFSGGSAPVAQPSAYYQTGMGAAAELPPRRCQKAR